MATISSTGVGSGLDVNGLVSQLVAAERAAPDKRISRADAKLTTEFSALAALKGALANFQSAAGALKSSDSLQQMASTTSDSTALTSTVTAAAAPGTYDVEVVQLAKAARLGSAVYAGGADTVIGTGTLTLSVGGKAFSIQLADGSNTLAKVRDAINAAKDNSGVRASLVRNSAGTGSYLVLTGTNTGAANSITVSTANPTAGLTQLAQDLQAFDAQKDVAAQDAIAFVAGYEFRSATNTVSGAIDGVTLNLAKAEPGKTHTLTVTRDNAAVQKRIESFVAAYNTLRQQITTLTKYDPATKTAGPLLGDAMLRNIDTQLRRFFSEPVEGLTGNYTMPSNLGISTTATGTLQLDAAKLTAALTADPTAASKVFSSTSGVAVRVSAFLDARLSSAGEIETRNKRITERREQLQADSEALDARMKVIQGRYLQQFTALDSMLAQMQSTSNYLTQQLSSLSK